MSKDEKEGSFLDEFCTKDTTTIAVEVKLTPEQQDIVKVNIPDGQVLKVKAFAGTGKTTTLKAFAEARPHDTFLYIAFNAAIAAEAAAKFPPNTKCQTVHSLAYGKVGFKYKAKIGFVKAYSVMECMKSIKNYGIALYIIDCLNNYFYSDDNVITSKHLTKGEDGKVKSADTEAFLVSQVQELWKQMQDLKNLKIAMTHDGYLKLFQLNKIQLHYDYIMLDEFQDSNKVTHDIFANQAAKKIMVGDTYQALYGFRKGEDISKYIENADSIERKLTVSFRFGNAIADIANTILECGFNEKSKLSGILGAADKIGNIDRNKPYCIVSRTNARLIECAFNLLKFETKKSFGFIGTSEKNNFDPTTHYRFDQLMDVYFLYKGEKPKIKDPHIKKFPNFEEFNALVNDHVHPDIELSSRSKIVLRFKDELPDVLKQIVEKSIDPVKADVVFSTCHRMKGLEHEQVMMTDDYGDIFEENFETGEIKREEDIDPQEINALYVGATRAKKCLQPNEQIERILEFREKYGDEASRPMR